METRGIGDRPEFKVNSIVDIDGRWQGRAQQLERLIGDYADPKRRLVAPALA